MRRGDGTNWLRDPFVLVAGALVLIPPIAAAVSALRNPWIATSDWAHIESQVRDVGSGDTPLVGAVSRFGWFHPGPLPFYAMALPYRLMPADRAMLFAAAVVNLVAVVGFVLVVARWSRVRAILALGGLAVVMWGYGVDDLADPWNPTLPLVPFALFAVICLEVALDQARWPLLAMCGLGSFLIQAHLAFVQPVFWLGLAAIGLRWRALLQDRYQEGGWRRYVRERWPSAALCVLVVVVASLPPLIDQVAGDGNLGDLARFAAGEDTTPGVDPLVDAKMPRHEVPQFAAWLLEPTGLWMGRSEPDSQFGTPVLKGGSRPTLLWIPLALGLAGLLARRVGPRREDADEDSRLTEGDDGCRPLTVVIVLAAAGVVATFAALPTIRGTLVYWPLRWAAVVVMLVWLALGWAVAAVVRDRIPNPVAQLARVGLVVAVVAVPVYLTVWRGSLGDQPKQDESEAMLRLRPAIERLGRQDEPVAVNATLFYGPEGLAVPVVLERAHIRWIDGADPQAAGRARFEVVQADRVSAQVQAAIDAGEGEIVARSGPATVNGSELLFIRWRPNDDERTDG